MDLLGIGKTIAGAVDTVADKFFVDAKEKEAFKLKALELQQRVRLRIRRYNCLPFLPAL